MAGAAVMAFDPARRSWIAEARADYSRVPDLDGELTADADAVSRAAADQGGVVYHVPVAVLRPGSIGDIQAILRYANVHAIKVGVRGAGHATLGQAQVEAGILIDTTTMGRVSQPSGGSMLVEAGARWLDVVTTALGAGVTPPNLPEHLAHSVGGTLAIGGVGDTSHRTGLIADNVRSLRVVTGKGEIVDCSRRHSGDLFAAALGGLCQHAVIVHADIEVVPAPEMVGINTYSYPSLSELVAAYQKAALSERFDELIAHIGSAPGHQWSYSLRAVQYDPAPSGRADSLRRAAFDVTYQEKDYAAWTLRSLGTLQFLEGAELADTPRPRLELLVSCDAAERVLATILNEVDADELASLPISIWAVRNGMEHETMPGVPEGPLCYAICVPRLPAVGPLGVSESVASNRWLFEQARDLGGKRFGASAIPFAQSDWVEHFGTGYFQQIARKHAFDPANVLGQGYGIFR